MANTDTPRRPMIVRYLDEGGVELVHAEEAPPVRAIIGLVTINPLARRHPR